MAPDNYKTGDRISLFPGIRIYDDSDRVAGVVIKTEISPKNNKDMFMFVRLPNGQRTGVSNNDKLVFLISRKQQKRNGF